ncbi:MAG: hypothetical protein KGL39_45270 [Patescibacteria group bacterium]|nr:hypothetical protein [Patescibacteria group bacterium]
MATSPISEASAMNGSPLRTGDGSQLVWHGVCSFWTDDMDQLARTSDEKFSDIYKSENAPTPDVPCCPYCGSPLFVVTLDAWQAEVKQMARKDEDMVLAVMWAKGRSCYRNTSLLKWAWRRDNSGH